MGQVSEGLTISEQTRVMIIEGLITKKLNSAGICSLQVTELKLCYVSMVIKAGLTILGDTVESAIKD